MSTETKIHAVDISISNSGTIFLFRPLNDAAKLHLEDKCADAQWFGGALVCEHRYASDLADALQHDCFLVE